MSWLNKILGSGNSDDLEQKPYRYDQIRQIAMVFNEPDNETLLSARSLFSDFKGVQKTYLIYSEGEKKVDNFVSGLKFNDKSFDWRKKPKKKEELATFLDMEYDILIDYSDGGSPKVDWVISKTKAKLKIGKSDKPIYQFKILTEEGDFLSYNTEILKYLNLINNVQWEE